MAGKTEKVTSGEAYAGQPCILCKKEIAAEDEVVVCPRCRSVQHADCWKSKGAAAGQAVRRSRRLSSAKSPKAMGLHPRFPKKPYLAAFWPQLP